MRNILRLLLTPFRWFAGITDSLREFFAEDPEDAPLADALQKTIENPVGVLYHLDALRKHLLRAVMFLAIATAISFTFINPILDFLSLPLDEGLQSLVAIDPTEPVGTVMRVALLSGFAISFPYLALEVWLFIGPGVSRRARMFGLLAIPIATLFFIGGMAFAYYVMLPAGLPFLLNFGGFRTELRPSSYIKFVTGLMFWIGLFFQFPLVTYVLAAIGLVNGRMLLSQWRLAIVIIAVIAAMITPTVDPVNMSLVMGPMVILYFLSIGLAFIAQGSRARRSSEQQANV